MFFFQGFLVGNTSPWIFYLSNIKKCFSLPPIASSDNDHSKYYFAFPNVYK